MLPRFFAKKKRRTTVTDEEMADEITTLFRLFGIKSAYAYVKSPASGKTRANMKFRIYWMRPEHYPRHPSQPQGIWIPDWMATEREGKFVQVYKKYTGWGYRDHKFQCNNVKAWRQKAHDIIEECKDDPLVEYFE